MEGLISKRTVDALEIGDELHDAEVRGFLARRLPSGAVSYGFRYRQHGKRSQLSLGLHGPITADQARTLAKKRAGEVADGKDPLAEREAARAKTERDASKTVNAVLDDHVKRHVEALKSADTIKSAFDRSVRPALGTKLIYEVTRADIVDMLDEVEDENGPSQADHTLAYLRKAFNWQMLRDDRFVSPIIKGMHRCDAHARRRRRILTDEEIRDVWLAAERATMRNQNPAPKCLPQFIQLLFLTAQRRTQVARCHSDQLGGGNWTIDGADYKNGETQVVPITAAIEGRLPARAGFLVSNDGGKTPFGDFSGSKISIDTEIALARQREGRKAMPHWVFHDIRRTARSIMSRYTTPDHAERVLGHAIPGVRGVYDQFEYADEKFAALDKLAAHVMGVVYPDPDKVVPLHLASRG